MTSNTDEIRTLRYHCLEVENSTNALENDLTIPWGSQSYMNSYISKRSCEQNKAGLGLWLS